MKKLTEGLLLTGANTCIISGIVTSCLGNPIGGILTIATGSGLMTTAIVKGRENKEKKSGKK